jgi:hypothetical protein
MRAIGVIQGHGRLQRVEKNIDDGIRSVIDAASLRSPTAAELEADFARHVRRARLRFPDATRSRHDSVSRPEEPRSSTSLC